jgi:hypothetical protein
MRSVKPALVGGGQRIGRLPNHRVSRSFAHGNPSEHRDNVPIESHGNATLPGAQPAPDGGGAWAGAPPDTFALFADAPGNRKQQTLQS